MIFRSLFLYLVGIKGFFRKLRFDLGRELVVGLAAVVLGSLFYYVFNDFINSEVASLSQPMRDAFAHFVGWVLLALAIVLTSRTWLNELSGKRSLAALAQFLGDAPPAPGLIRTLQMLNGALCWFGLMWILMTSMSLVEWSLATSAGIQTAALAACGVTTFILRGRPEKRLIARDRTFRPVRTSSSAFYALINWRFELTARRLRDTRLCLGAAAVCLGALCYLGFRAAPAPAMVGVAFVSGAFTAAALTLGLGADLRAAWIEKSSGVAHDEFVRAWQWVAWGLGIGSGLLTLALTLAPHLLLLDVTWTHISESLKLGALAALMPILFPSLMLQIDGRRPMAQIMAQLLVGLFVGTAVYAHWAGLILVPIVHSYARGLQHGRFYRA